MANFLITTPNSLTQGTDTQDLFDLRTGGAVSIIAAGGADTISAAATRFTGANIQAGAGNDTVIFGVTGSVLDNASILLGAGADVLTLAGFQAGISSAGGGVDIFGGGDNDSITIGTGASLAGSSQINGGQGNDTINILSGLLFTNSLIAGGGGNDFISVTEGTFSGATINGGGGNDSITMNGTFSNTRIEGDTLTESEFFGNDTITIGGIFGSGSMLQGGQGNDRILISADFSTGATIEGNAGNDSIFINAFVASGGTFVGGGAGNDTITVSGLLVNNFGTIQGGGGNDVINVSGGGADGGFIFGGAGADTINLGVLDSGGVVDVAASGINIGYAAFSESTLGSFDLVSGVATGGAFMVNQSVVNFTVGTLVSDLVTVTGNGFATFTSTISNSLTARVAVLDGVIGAGGAVVFDDGTSRFLFVQGGSTGGGNADDLIVQLGGDIASIGRATGGISRVSNSQLKVTFG